MKPTKKLKRSRREISAAVLKELGMAGPDPAMNSDAQLNAEFEQALRDRGRRRNEIRLGVLGKGPIDEDAAAIESLQEDVAFAECCERALGKSGRTVVINRRTRSKTKGAKSR